ARDVSGLDTQFANVQSALNTLLSILRAAGGFVGIPQGDKYEGAASLRSLPLGGKLRLPGVQAEHLRPGEGVVAGTAWLVPAWGGGEQLGVIGLGPRSNGGPYAEEDLDLVVEAADAAGRLLQAGFQQARDREQIRTLADKMDRNEINIVGGT